MAIQRVGPFDRSVGVAGADLSDKLFCAVDRDAATGNIVLCAAGDNPLGFIIETAKQGRGVSYTVRSANIVNGLAGGAISLGDEIEVGTGGTVIKSTTAGDGFGYARKAAAINDVVEIEFK